MSLVTLAFSDDELEASFRTELASNAVGVGVLTNGVTLVAMAAGLFSSAKRGPCSLLWPQMVVFAMGAAGLASNVCLGRLGRPELEHKLLVAVGVIVMFCGSMAFVVGGALSSLPSDCPSRSVLNSNEISLLVGLFLAVTIAMHVLAFPFHARLIIHACSLTAAVTSFNLYSLVPNEMVFLRWAIWPIVLFAEAVGYMLHRMARLQFVEKQQLAAARAAEKSAMESERRALNARLEQLIGERDFATYEALLARQQLEQTSIGDGVGNAARRNRRSDGRGDERWGELEGSEGSTSTTGNAEIEAIMRAHHELFADEQQGPPADGVVSDGVPPGNGFAGRFAGGIAGIVAGEHKQGGGLELNDSMRARPAVEGIQDHASLGLPEHANSPLFLARQKALWQTLEDAGLLPERPARGGDGEGGAACLTYTESDQLSDLSRRSSSKHEHAAPRISKKDV